MRCGVAKSVTRDGKKTWWRCRHGIGYLLARSVLYEALAIRAAAYPSDVILVNHILSIQWCAAPYHPQQCTELCRAATR